MATDADAHGRHAEEEFEPLGTLTLVFLYFLALVLMWIFTYFIEFLGNEPTPMIIA